MRQPGSLCQNVAGARPLRYRRPHAPGRRAVGIGKRPGPGERVRVDAASPPTRAAPPSPSSSSSTSAADVTTAAPSRSNAWTPALASGPTGPGTAPTSRPSSSACDAVMSAPLGRPAWTTTVTRPRAAMMRFRRGNRPASGRVPGGNSLASTPRSRMAANRDLWAAGYSTSRPPATTPAVGPPASSAARWAAPSIPRAMPLTTHTPDAARSPARSRASLRPYSVARRVPTTATARSTGRGSGPWR